MKKRRKGEFVTNWEEVPVIIDIPYAAWLLGCSMENVRKMCQFGKLKAFKLGDKMWRIRKEAIIEFMKGGN